MPETQRDPTLAPTSALPNYNRWLEGPFHGKGPSAVSPRAGISLWSVQLSWDTDIIPRSGLLRNSIETPTITTIQSLLGLLIRQAPTFLPCSPAHLWEVLCQASSHGLHAPQRYVENAHLHWSPGPGFRCMRMEVTCRVSSGLTHWGEKAGGLV